MQRHSCLVPPASTMASSPACCTPCCRAQVEPTLSHSGIQGAPINPSRQMLHPNLAGGVSKEQQYHAALTSLSKLLWLKAADRQVAPSEQEQVETVLSFETQLGSRIDEKETPRMVFTSTEMTFHMARHGHSGPGSGQQRERDEKKDQSKCIQYLS